MKKTNAGSSQIRWEQLKSLRSTDTLAKILAVESQHIYTRYDHVHKAR